MDFFDLLTRLCIRLKPHIPSSFPNRVISYRPFEMSVTDRIVELYRYDYKLESNSRFALDQ